MERMLDVPERAVLLADEADHPTPKVTWWRSLHATSTRRALLLTALGGLLIAGVLIALPRGEGGNGLQANAISLGLRGAETFGKAKSGDCLNWPERTPDAAEVVDCKDEHRFEVAESVDMRTFPGSEYGPDAEPPSPARIQQISQEQCQVAVRRYLGERFDPNSRYTVSMMWSGDKAWRQSGERRMLCGLQLPGPNNTQLAFQGKVADIDQSKVWPAGTCLGIDPSTNQPTDIPVDCAGPHAMEVTGAVNVAEKFPAGLPPDPEQDAFIKDACTRMTDAYLAPIQLRSTTLTLIYSTISLPSWAAGSHQVSCSIGATLGNGGWSTLLNSAKGPLQINGQPPIPPPAIPEERLNFPPIPMPDVSSSAGQSSSQTDYSQSTQQTQQTQHGQQSAGTTATHGPSTSAAPAPAPAPEQGNIFMNGPPPGAPPAAPGEAPPPPGAGTAASGTATSMGGHRRRIRRRYRASRPPARATARAHHQAHLRRPSPTCSSHRRPEPSSHRCLGVVRAVRMSPQRFDELVSDALDLIPADLAAAFDNVVVLVADRNPEEPDLLGLYQGIALTERDSSYAGSLPDTITIYREALLDICESEDEVVDEVAITVIHEIAHHFGIDDDRLHELGWA
jgi:predicted Zn-dependent protease with MMP-like domain/predicted heme/steroid binding protein